MAKPRNTKATKWKLTVGTPCRFLTRKQAVEWAKTYKLPYTITKGPKYRGSSYPHTWELRVYQPTLWKGRKVFGSSNYGLPFPNKKQAMSSYRYGKVAWELVRLPTGAYIFIEARRTFKALFQTDRTKPRKEITVHVGNQGGLYFMTGKVKTYLKKLGWAYNDRGKAMSVFGRR